ncbi:hypothetical protein ONZ45_g19529 [Pleurotus djamor]|nr:hypothetical protein ONZ45_g19529 [Pleurotus djamor]
MSTEAPAGTHKDPVTGEMISKQELKRREKQRAKEANKASKAATQPQAKPKATTSASAAEAEADLNPNQYYELRSRQILALKASQSPNPYPHKFIVTKSLEHYIRDYGKEGKIPSGTKLDGSSVL